MTLRTSSYTIYVDLPGEPSDMLLVHGYTGAYDKVSRKVATYLRSLDPVRPPKPLYGDWTPEPAIEGQPPAPSEQTLEVLKKRGYLTEKAAEEESALFSNMAELLHRKTLQSAPGYIFMPTYDCNLRCPYCFQDHMRTNPAFTHLLRTMRREMVDRIFLALPRIESKHGIQPGAAVRRQVTFFGGEPLLRAGRDVVAYIMDKTRALGEADFNAVSNGTELDAYLDLLGPSGISLIQITLDGPRHEHDRRRIYADGRGSFDVIGANVTRALEAGTRVSLRMNVDRNNIEQLPELAEEIMAQGWDRHPLFSAYTAPVHANNGKTDRKSVFGSWELDQALNAMREKDPRMRIILRPDDGMMARVRRIFDRRADPVPDFRSTYCSAHDRMYIFDAFGDIYACWERTGDSSIRIGHIQEDGELAMNAPLELTWRSRTVAANPVCLKCRYAMYCGGGCAVLAEGATGKLTANFCDGFAKRFRAATAEAYGAHLRGEAALSVDAVCDQ
jgi:uncharacterized protein